MFVKAITTDGSEYVSEFTKLTNLRRYAADVMAGRKAFTAWEIVGTEHPVTGEQVLMRNRIFVNGAQIQAILQIDKDGLVVAIPQSDGGLGMHTVKESDGFGDTPVGTVVPVHRDSESLRRYVVGAGGTVYHLDPDYSVDNEEDEDEDDIEAYDNDEEDGA